jgi:hypothetical protein
MFDDTLKCAFCFNLCERPITVRVGFFFIVRARARKREGGRGYCRSR